MIDHVTLDGAIEAFIELRFAGATHVDDIESTADIPEVIEAFTTAGPRRTRPDSRSRPRPPQTRRRPRRRIPGDVALGVAHVVTHPSTWSATRYAYLEDLFVGPAARGTGVAGALIEAVYARADGLGAGRVYWHTQEYDGAARSLYDQVGHRTSFVVYER